MKRKENMDRFTEFGPGSAARFGGRRMKHRICSIVSGVRFPITLVVKVDRLLRKTMLKNICSYAAICSNALRSRHGDRSTLDCPEVPPPNGETDLAGIGNSAPARENFRSWTLPKKRKSFAFSAFQFFKYHPMFLKIK